MTEFDNLLFMENIPPIGKEVCFERENSKHLKALRKKPGDRDIFLTDGKGLLANIELTEYHSGRFSGRIIESEYFQRSDKVEIFLAAAILKGKRYDWLIEKATELGVANFIPLLSRRVNKSQSDKSDRWRKKVISALIQSKQVFMPIVFPETNISKIKEKFPAVEWICFHEKSESELTPSAIELKSSKIGILIGPEGGFTDEEASNFRTYKIPDVTRLRAETAAISAVNIVRILHRFS